VSPFTSTSRSTFFFVAIPPWLRHAKPPFFFGTIDPFFEDADAQAYPSSFVNLIDAFFLSSLMILSS